MNKDSIYMDIIQASEHLGLKVSRIRYAVKYKQMPYIKIGRLVKFDRNELDKWIKSLAVYPVETPRQIVREIRAKMKNKLSY